MKTILALAATSLIALSAPVFAQNAGAPGATGTGGSLTGSNPGTGFGYGQNYGDSINPGPGPGYSEYPNRPGNGGFGYNSGYGDEGGVYMNEGRAAAPDYDEDGPDYGAPSHAWRPRSQTPGVGADLVGPGSSMDKPTGGHDVSR